EAVSVRPDFADGMNRLAQAYNRLGLRNQAIATIQRAIELEPFNPAHIATFGWLQLDQNYPDSAVRLFTQAVEIDHAHPSAQRGHAEIARRDGQYDVALEHLKIAIDDPRLGALTRLDLETFAGEIQEEQVAHQALQARFEDGTATESDHGEMAAIMARRARWPQAVTLQRQAGDSASSQERLAYMLFEAQEYLESRKLYTQLAAESDRADLFVNEGVCAAVVGDDPGAVTAFRNALQRNPDLSAAQLYLANALLRLGKIDSASVAYDAFLADNRTGESAERVRRILKQIAPSAEGETP
ncbi:MAG: tetratricopeptide repeat protein, partial [Acidobacteriota bacterium]|nr:tetratricopeptide repeat protein [Acidobacteriota bacterium]